jgi:DNA-binding winged helix-turn-helix (wHTH) protein/TolB-like protein
MQHVPGLGAGGDKDCPKPPVRFAGFVLNVDACTLTRDSGEAVALTRGEFSLLSFLACRPGRVVSRDTLLAATANRRFEPFDRSIDTLIGRLRRKIEPDPKQPRLIVTVPGKGYRFDGLTHPLVAARTFCADVAGAATSKEPSALPPGAGVAGATLDAQPTLPPPGDDQVRAWPRFWQRSGRASVLIPLCVGLLVILAIAGRSISGASSVPGGSPSLMVLPFVNLTGDASNDRLGRALAYNVLGLLSAYPGVRVAAHPDSAVSPVGGASQAARPSGARYVVTGAIQRMGDALQVVATLSASAAGETIWSEAFSSVASDGIDIREDIPRRIYDCIAGFRGVIHDSEGRISWSKAPANMNEYDYYFRGQSLYLRSTLPDVLRARGVFQEGLSRYPESTLLRLELAWTYVWTAMSEATQERGPDIDRAWRFAAEAVSAPSPSRLEAWLGHWLMAFLYQWHDSDFSRSVAEARKAINLAPYDAFSRNELSWVLANAGLADEAIAWARAGLEHDPNGPSRRHANLAWAYYMAGRDREAFETLREKRDEFPILAATLHVRLGEVEKAKALIARYVQAGGRATVHREDSVPLIEPVRTEYVDALRKTGLPD